MKVKYSKHISGGKETIVIDIEIEGEIAEVHNTIDRLDEKIFKKK